MVIEIGCQALSLRAVLAMPELIPFIRLVVTTTRVLAELVAMFVSVVASQATKSETALNQVTRVISALQLSLVSQISKVPPPVLLVANAQTILLCQIYGKNHKGVCRAGSDVCFDCGKPGHRVRYCP